MHKNNIMPCFAHIEPYNIIPCERIVTISTITDFYAVNIIYYFSFIQGG